MTASRPNESAVIVVPRSLRAKLTLASVLLVAVVLSIAAALIVVLQRDQLQDSIDDGLEREVADVAAALGQPNYVLGERGEDRFTQIIGSDRSVLTASAAVLREEPLINPVDVKGEGLFVTSSDIPIEDDEFRLFARTVDVDGQSYTIVVGENADDLRDNVWSLVITLAILVPLATAILGGVAWYMIGQTLAPVAAIQRQVGHITLNRLGDRIPVPSTNDEIAELATTMNEMLDRLDRANERQQNFIGDASHELRSPLTRLRTSLEVDLADPDRDLNKTGHELLGDVEDLQSLVEDLLFLARLDADTEVRFGPVDLDAIIDRSVGQLPDHSEVVVETHAVEAVVVDGHEAQLTRLVVNLLTNAVRHAETQVLITATTADSTVLLRVEDDGPGIPVADRGRVFERFTRLDESRTGATGGAGLGLAIAAEIVRAHGGKIAIGDCDLGGAKFEVALPSLKS